MKNTPEDCYSGYSGQTQEPQEAQEVEDQQEFQDSSGDTTCSRSREPSSAVRDAIHYVESAWLHTHPRSGPAARFIDELRLPQPSTLPLADYVVLAVDFQRIVAEGGDNTGSGWVTPLWHFTWLMRGHPEMVRLDADAAADDIVRLFGTLPALTSEFEPDGDPWECLFCDAGGSGGNEIEFLTNWDRIRCAAGWEPLRWALERAKQQPLPVERYVAKKWAPYRAFVSIGGWLQVTMGDRNIMLPCKEMGAILFPQLNEDASKVSVSRLRQLAITDGFLREVRPHIAPREGRAGRATEFRFDVTRFECLEQAAAR